MKLCQIQSYFVIENVIDNVTLLLWKSSYFSSRQTVGIAGDGHSLVGFLILIKSKIWIVSYCLGSHHGTMVYAMCFITFLMKKWYRTSNSLQLPSRKYFQSPVTGDRWLVLSHRTPHLTSQKWNPYLHTHGLKGKCSLTKLIVGRNSIG